MSWSETKLLMDGHDEILSKMERGAVKSVQRGVTAVGDQERQDVILSRVDPGKTFVYVSTYTSYKIPTDSSATTGVRTSIGYLANETTLRLLVSGKTVDHYILWQVVEFY